MSHTPKSPLSNLSTFSLNEDEFKILTPQLARTKLFSKAYSEENLNYYPKSKLLEQHVFKEQRARPSIKEFGKTVIRKVSLNGFSNIVVEVVYGTRTWIKSLSRQSFLRFYTFVDENSFISHDIIIPQHILHSNIHMDLPLHTSNRLFGDHIFIFLTELIKNPIFFQDKEVGLQLCILLDNDFQSLETAYELDLALKQNASFSKIIGKLKTNFSANNPLLTPTEDSFGNFDSIMTQLPNLELTISEDNKRKQIVNMVNNIVLKVICCRCFAFGSSLFKTSLPGEPILVTICVNNKVHHRDWFKQVVSHLCGLSVLDPTTAALKGLGKFTSTKTIRLDEVKFFPEEKTISFCLNSYKVVLSANQFENLCFYGFYQEINSTLIRKDFLKDVFFLARTALYYQLELFRETKETYTTLQCLDGLLLTFIFQAIILLRERNQITESCVNTFKLCLTFVDTFDWTKFNERRYFLLIQKFISTESDSMSRSVSNAIQRYQAKWDYGMSKNKRSVLEPLAPLVETTNFMPDQRILEEQAKTVRPALKALYELSISEAKCTLQVSSTLKQHLIIASEETGKRVSSHFVLAKTEEKLKYFSLILFSQIEQQPLLNLIRQVLYEKGPLPIGEIGKVLQILTNNTDFTQALKEEFGGLKKLLEVNQEKFYLATDHPYNPKVYITELLSQQDRIDLQNELTPNAYLTKVMPHGGTSDKTDEGKQKRRRQKKKKQIEIPKHEPMTMIQEQQPAQTQNGIGSMMKSSRSMMDFSALQESEGFFSLMEALESPTGFDNKKPMYSQSAAVINTEYTSSTTLSSVIEENEGLDHDQFFFT